MPKRERIVRHIALDPPIYLKPGDVFQRKHVIQAGTLVGRVLFTEPSVLIEIVSGDFANGPVKIAHCEIEVGQ